MGRDGAAIAGAARRYGLARHGAAVLLSVLVVLVVVSPGGGSVGRVTAAAASPSIQSFTVAPSSLLSAGGRVTLSATVANASSCKFSSSTKLSGLPVTVSCSSGSASTSVTLPANTGTAAKVNTFNLTATTGKSSVQATPVTVSVAPPPGPSVSLFDATPTYRSGDLHEVDRKRRVAIPDQFQDRIALQES